MKPWMFVLQGGGRKFINIFYYLCGLEHTGLVLLYSFPLALMEKLTHWLAYGGPLERSPQQEWEIQSSSSPDNGSLPSIGPYLFLEVSFFLFMSRFVAVFLTV